MSSGNYSSRFSGVAAGAVLPRGTRRSPPKLRAIARAPAADESALDCAAWSRRSPHWYRCDACRPGTLEPGSARRRRSSRARNLEPPDEDDTVASSAAHGFFVDVAVVEVDRETGEVHVLDYATVHDAGRCSTR